MSLKWYLEYKSICTVTNVIDASYMLNAVGMTLPHKCSHDKWNSYDIWLGPFPEDQMRLPLRDVKDCLGKH